MPVTHDPIIPYLLENVNNINKFVLTFFIFCEKYPKTSISVADCRNMSVFRIPLKPLYKAVFLSIL